MIIAVTFGDNPSVWVVLHAFLSSADFFENELF